MTKRNTDMDTSGDRCALDRTGAPPYNHNLGGTLQGGRMQAAFFDLDKTLITVNSARLWMMRMYRQGRVGRMDIAAGGLFLLAYHLGVVDMERATRKALSTVIGSSEDELRRETEAWFNEEVIPVEAPGARGVIEEHRRAGHRLVLLTSSSPYASACAVAHWGLDDFLSMRYQIVDGRFTGGVVLPLCFREGKVHYAEALAAAEGIDLDESWFYTDSTTDLPMLERVGHPQVVGPDPRLRREARRRGWPILDWS
ncbi:MAG: HAD family hydrolase [Pseudomonadota bacterium]